MSFHFQRQDGGYPIEEVKSSLAFMEMKTIWRAFRVYCLTVIETNALFPSLLSRPRALLLHFVNLWALKVPSLFLKPCEAECRAAAPPTHLRPIRADPFPIETTRPLSGGIQRFSVSVSRAIGHSDTRTLGHMDSPPLSLAPDGHLSGQWSVHSLDMSTSQRGQQVWEILDADLISAAGHCDVTSAWSDRAWRHRGDIRVVEWRR
ncbi:hypothetical protein EGW08_015823 [Elysia chlorotica]|uniref:Uncharacterized protein n=1 Tax=Elysia chlorotica TaxID=188477 RepID=A0A433T4A4_ELYCH|nr:hypothetical protein EGW08_015823 [Elysia chlorotica]